MAEIKSTGSVVVELSIAELELIRRSLRLSAGGYSDRANDMDEARDLLADLEATK